MLGPNARQVLRNHMNARRHTTYDLLDPAASLDLATTPPVPPATWSSCSRGSSLVRSAAAAPACTIAAGIGNMVHFAHKEVLADIGGISTVAGELAVATQVWRRCS